MESLDNGPEREPDRFAREVANAFRAAGATEIEYDADGFLLRYRSGDGSPAVANLANVFHECAEADAEDRAAGIDRFVAAMTASANVPTGWDEVAALLRPVLRPAGYAQGSGDDVPLAREFQPLLNEMVIIDQPGLMAYVAVNAVLEWNVTEVAVFDQARANLAALAAVPAAEPGRAEAPTALRFVDSGDDYWASRLLIDGWLATMADQVSGRPVAFLPDPTGLIIGADEPTLLGRLLEAVEQQYLEAARPLSPQAYTVDAAGRVVPYAVPDGDPLWNAVHRSAVLFATQEYAAQKESHDGTVDGFVASLTVVGRPDGGVRSLAVWGEGVDGLLPRADYVAFVNDDLTFTVPWEVVARETGLAPEPGWSPIRYRARAWPGPPVIERLRAAATSP